MKTYEEITAIIDNLTEEVFQKLCKDEDDRWASDRRISKNGTARLIRRLAKYGLTVAEWDWWCY